MKDVYSVKANCGNSNGSPRQNLGVGREVMQALRPVHRRGSVCMKAQAGHFKQLLQIQQLELCVNVCSLIFFNIPVMMNP
jgi:hypothetical protein